MRKALVVLSLSLSLSFAASATAQVSIGINFSSYPQLVPVPGYPVYYAPQAESNYFFYDGAYWVFQDDDWYASSWYNGPWQLVSPDAVPLYVLRVPVRYYRRAPSYFRAWRSDAPPRWNERWGSGWERNHAGWDRWNRNAAPPPAPLPIYQRQFSGARYPRPEQQQELHTQNYRYQPRDAEVGQQYQRGAMQRGSQVPSERYRERQERGQGQGYAPAERSREWQDRGQAPGAAPGAQQQGRPAVEQQNRPHQPPPREQGAREVPRAPVAQEQNSGREKGDQSRYQQ
ncbi:MAG: hypothetical protein M3Z31_08700 [Pseudomonadota bacterium]|nr:hypothetical protein [Pseudomonadota bacterium]